MKKLALCTLLALSPFALTGCDNQKSVEQTESTIAAEVSAASTNITSAADKAILAHELENNRFTLIAFNGSSIQLESSPFIQFTKDMQISGKMCNNFFGQGALENNQLKAVLGMTLMMCENAQLNDLDKVIASMLSNGATVTENNGQLVLTQGDNTLVYQFDKVVEDNSAEATMIKPEDLIHHQFKLISIDGNPVENTLVSTLSFGENLHLSGIACNNFSGDATLKEDVITAPVLAMTRKFCESETLNKLDSTLTQLFANGAKTQLNQNTLTLSQGSTVLVYQLDDVKN